MHIYIASKRERERERFEGEAMGCSWDRIVSIIVLAIAFFGCVVVSAISIAEEGTVIGIDIGTSNSRVGVFKDGKIEIEAVPSWVAFTETLSGEAAENQAANINPETTIFHVKTSIGSRKFDEIKDGEKSPEEITTRILSAMKKRAETLLGKNVKDAVLTVPAYFSSTQREAIKEAGTKAGLNVVTIIEEPIAAAIAFGLEKKGGEKNILVFDLGGGTLDVTILKTVDDGTFKILATNTSNHLGGKDFDINTMETLVEETIIKVKGKYTIRKNNTARAVLRRKCERAKLDLSRDQEALIEIDNLLHDYDFSKKLTRRQFIDLNKNLFDKIIQFVDTTLKGIPEQIDEILVVGGNSRIPQLQKRLQEYFNGMEPIKGVIDPDEVVAYGAAVKGITLFSGDAQETLVSHHINDPADIVHTTRQYLIDLTGIPPSTRGTPEIEIKFKVDAYGILNVKAEDTGTGKPMKITITNDKGWWSQDEINRMIREEEEEFAEEVNKLEKGRIAALETYIKNQINDKLDKRLKSALDWLHENQNAKKQSLKDVEAVCKPIINTAVYQRTARDMTHDEL